MARDGIAHGDGVSIILPAYNEAAVIAESIDSMRRALDGTQRPYEIIVADDCSRDDTREIVTAYAARFPNVRLATHSPNRGKGAAIRTGFAAARHPIVAYIDADIRTDTETMERYLHAVESVDIVLANKWDSDSSVEYTFFRRFASTAYAVFAKALFWVPIVDTQCGFKFFRRKTLESAMPHLHIDRFGFDVELLSVCLKNGATWTALPIDVREVRQSRVTRLDMLKMFKDLLIARIWIWKLSYQERRGRRRVPVHGVVREETAGQPQPILRLK